MAVTDIQPAAAEAPDTPLEELAQHSRFVAVVGAGDHKVIGRLYIVTSLLLALLAGITGELSGLERASVDVLPTDTQFQVLTLHSISAVFLFLVPLLIGIALVVVPLQVGANSVAFPRAAAASYWCYLVSGVILAVSYALNGGPGGGHAKAVSLFLAALVALVVSLALATVCLCTTVIALRATGMTLDRVPFFAWGILTAGFVWLLSFGALALTGVLMWVDHRYGSQSLGVNKDLYAHLQWAVQQPQVYAWAAPVLGFTLDAAGTAAGRRVEPRGAAFTMLGAFAVLGFGAWATGTFNENFATQPLFVAVAFLALVPVLATIGLVLTTVRSGDLRITSPLVFGVLGTLVLLVAVIEGAMYSIDGLNLTGTVAAAGVSHAAALAGVLAAAGALHHWSTKIVGRRLAEPPAVLAAFALFAGALALSVPDFISGFANGTDQIDGVKANNVIGTYVGGGLVIIGLLVVIVNLLGGLRRRGEAEPADPWDGQTLEWATASPPPLENFAEPPVVTSATPLLDQREEANA